MSDQRRHPWPHDELADDFEYAVTGDEGTTKVVTRLVGIDLPHLAPLTVEQIERIEHWHVSYHGKTWEPGQDTGTELELYALLKLRDGRWASVVAGNDYTGWGCQDFADVRIGTRAEVIKRGLDEEGRRQLGLSAKGSRDE